MFFLFQLLTALKILLRFNIISNFGVIHQYHIDYKKRYILAAADFSLSVDTFYEKSREFLKFDLKFEKNEIYIEASDFSFSRKEFFYLVEVDDSLHYVNSESLKIISNKNQIINFLVN